MSVTCKRNWDAPIWKSRIEVGRWWNIPTVNRVFDLCCIDIDTELHYLFECHSHKIKEIRDQHIPNYYSRYLSTLKTWKDCYQFVTFEKYFIVYLKA